MGQPSEVVLLVRGIEVVRWQVSNPPPPDLAVVDVLARIVLVCRRQGWAVELRHPCGQVVELLELAGLAEVVDAAARAPARSPGGCSPSGTTATPGPGRAWRRGGS